MLLHPRQMLDAVLDDAVEVPLGQALLLHVVLHEPRIHLVDVLVAADDHVADALVLLGRALGGKPEAEHHTSSS